MKRFKTIKVLALILLVVIGGGFILNKTQTMMYDLFNPPKSLDLKTLHLNEEAYETEIKFDEKDKVREYKVSDYDKEMVNQKYKDIKFDDKTINNKNAIDQDITFIGMIFLIAMIVLIVVIYRLLISHLK